MTSSKNCESKKHCESSPFDRYPKLDSQLFEEGLGGGLERVFHNTKESRQKPARKSLLEPEGTRGYTQGRCRSCRSVLG